MARRVDERPRLAMEAGSALCEELPWDSSFFGLSIARVVPSRLDHESCDAALDWCRSRRVDCLYFLCALDDTSTQAVVTNTGFHLVSVKVTLARSSEAGRGEIQGHVRRATDADVPRLRDIASASHLDTRFHSDGNFDPARCRELYATWIENSVHGYADHVMVAERDSSAVGYITLHVDGKESPDAGTRTARIGLFAVDERWRNRGVGRDLLRRTAALLRELGVEETSVVAAGRNVAGLKLYKSEGFHTTDVALWYHRWFRDGKR